MTRQRYNTTESWNRILRLFQGKAVATDQPATMGGEVLSTDECVSDLTELLSGSLPNEVAELPASLVCTVPEANEPTNPINTRAMTPASHAWAHEYGGIYVSTGTVSSPNQIIPATTWTKVTGTFKHTMWDSGAEIYCDPANDQVVINEVGNYFVIYHIDILNRGNAVTLEMMSYLNALPQYATRSYVELGASGTVDGSKALVAFGEVYAPATGSAMSLYIYASAATTIKVAAAQLTVEKMNG
jgi:hypothetical protein